MKRVIIGISASITLDQSRGFEGYRKSSVSEDYINAVIKNGGIPFIIPINKDEDLIKAQVDQLDGLLLTGGADVDPVNYGQEPLEKLQDTLSERDFFELKLLDSAKKRAIPVLGICRGFQLMNVYYGGSLYQDLSYNKDVYIKHNQVIGPRSASHSVEIVEESKLFSILNEKSLRVNSFHHQILDQIGNGLKATAFSKDGVVEAIEDDNYKFMLGLQWHPEMMHYETPEMNKIFKAFIEMANVK